MAKKKYIKPELEIVDMQSRTELLAGSDGDDTWWKEPEVEDGCQSAWWCGK